MHTDINSLSKNQVTYKGKPYTVYTNAVGEKYIVVDGRRCNLYDIFGMNEQIRQKLVKTPLDMINYYNDLLEKSEEKKANLKTQALGICKQLKNMKDALHQYLTSINVRSVSDITDSRQQKEAKIYTTSISDLSSAKTSNSNRYYSACMDSFQYALDGGKWLNQYSLAEAVAKNLNG